METWKDIQGYENIYQVSNMGNVRRHKLCPFHKTSGRAKNMENGLLTPFPLAKTGKKAKYRQIWLSKLNKGGHKKFVLHRLVAKTFIPNPLNKPEINHKNGKKDDNRVENLEWATGQENYLHAVKLGLCQPSKKEGYCI